MTPCGAVDGDMFVAVMLCMDRAVFGDGVVQVVVGQEVIRRCALYWWILFCKLLVFSMLYDPIYCRNRTVGRSR